jgi:hypothetical protein
LHLTTLGLRLTTLGWCLTSGDLGLTASLMRRSAGGRDEKMKGVCDGSDRGSTA